MLFLHILSRNSDAKFMILPWPESGLCCEDRDDFDMKIVPMLATLDQLCISYSYQQPFKLQSWHFSQSIYDHVGGDVSVTRDTTVHAARAWW